MNESTVESPESQVQSAQGENNDQDLRLANGASPHTQSNNGNVDAGAESLTKNAIGTTKPKKAKGKAKKGGKQKNTELPAKTEPLVKTSTEAKPVPAEGNEPKSIDGAENVSGDVSQPTDGAGGQPVDNLTYHQLIARLPLMRGDAYQRLKEDITLNGQRDAIVTYQGQILDGRNRYRACCDIGIAPKTQEWDGKGDLLTFVLSGSAHRLHQSESLRAITAAIFMDSIEKGECK